MLYEKRHELTKPIVEKLYNRVTEVFDKDFLSTWYQGLLDAYSNTEGLPITHLYWLWWITKAFGNYFLIS